MAGDIRIIETSDGSQSLFIKSLNETYHSTHGALNESQYVFLEKGLSFWVNQSNKRNIKILEVGFGTGLNALLTWAYAKKNPDVDINYITLEPFPLDDSIYSNLRYAELIDGMDHNELIRLHGVPFDGVERMENFSFSKRKLGVRDYKDEALDLIYFDAFAPSKQAEMWDIDIFKSLYHLLNTGGALVTYCAQGQFKRNIVEVGFHLETLQGPPGKKEMVRAIKLE